jgi:catechol 2,3-dioxygenase-like lactoylglutathione lyase family enzyme
MDIVRGHAVAYGTADGGQVCAGNPVVAGLFHPTFLYESIWDIGMAFLILYLDRRFRMGRGTVAALYFMGYTLGRGWIEALRHDHANHILGLRLNDWTSIAVFLFGLVLFLTRGGFSPQREESPYRSPPGPEASGTEAPATGSTANAGTGKPPEDIRGAPAEDVRAAASTEEVHADVDADASRRPADD